MYILTVLGRHLHLEEDTTFGQVFRVSLKPSIIVDINWNVLV